MQNMASGKTHHLFILNSGSKNALSLINKTEKQLSRYGIKSQHITKLIDDIKKGIDASMRLIVLINKDVIDGVNDNEMVKEGSSYASKHANMMSCILLKHGSMRLSLIGSRLSKIDPYLSRIDTILAAVYQYPLDQSSSHSTTLNFLLSLKE